MTALVKRPCTALVLVPAKPPYRPGLLKQLALLWWQREQVRRWLEALWG